MIAIWWDLLIGWAGIGLVVCALAAAVAILLPPWLDAIVPNLRVVAIVVAIVSGTSTLVYTKGYLNGAAEVQERWDAAKSAAIKAGEKARRDAERDIRDHPTPRVRDPYRRD